jgi:hypothetical protein
MEYSLFVLQMVIFSFFSLKICGATHAIASSFLLVHFLFPSIHPFPLSIGFERIFFCFLKPVAKGLTVRFFYYLIEIN